MWCKCANILNVMPYYSMVHYMNCGILGPGSLPLGGFDLVILD